jgi:hypothetical protein
MTGCMTGCISGCIACCRSRCCSSVRIFSTTSRASASTRVSTVCSTSRPTTTARSRSNVTVGAPLLQLIVITPVASRKGIPTSSTN